MNKFSSSISIRGQLRMTECNGAFFNLNFNEALNFTGRMK